MRDCDGLGTWGLSRIEIYFTYLNANRVIILSTRDKWKDSLRRRRTTRLSFRLSFIRVAIGKLKVDQCTLNQYYSTKGISNKRPSQSPCAREARDQRPILTFQYPSLP